MATARCIAVNIPVAFQAYEYNTEVIIGFDFKQNREAYKTVRQRVRNVMVQRKLNKPAIFKKAKHYLDENYPDAYVDLNDLWDDFRIAERT